MGLKTMEPAPDWDPEEHPDVVEAFAALDEDVVITVWGRDSCGDCQRELPGFAAALEAAGFPTERLRVVPVNHFKEGPLVEAYGIGYIATIVIERCPGVDAVNRRTPAGECEELARFVEAEDVPATEYLAAQLRGVEASA